MHKPATIFGALVLCALAGQAHGKPIDEKTVRTFLVACAKDKDECIKDISDQVMAEDADGSGTACLTDDMRDEPITIYRAMLRWLTGNRKVAAMPPATAIETGAKILYPCNP